jgi:GNAT superfamily N-acetyltransferase
MTQEWHRDRYLISTDRQRLDLELIHDFLSNQSYWAIGRSMTAVKQSIEHSFPFGLYHETQQIGFARVITDFVTYAYIADVFVLEAYRSQGLGQWLIKTMLNHPDLQDVRRWSLITHDAHDLYRKFGFTELAHPDRHLERSITP